MLVLMVGGTEHYDEETNRFLDVGGTEVHFEHSLLTVSKWESIVQKPFLADNDKTPEEVQKYVEAMIISPNPPLNVYELLTGEQLQAIHAYIDSPRTATTFKQLPKATGPKEIITSELVYYWMVVFNIPFECETWHLNRLFALINICNVKNTKQKPKSQKELIAERRALNEQRRAELKTSG